jgi:outer membrane protein assembly factor BamB
MVYNTAANMIRRSVFSLMAMLVSILAACAARAGRPLVDPFPLTFPLAEARTLDIDGHVVGQPRARNGIVYFAAKEGSLTAVVIPSRSILWRFKADHPLASGPELSADRIVVRDDDNVLYVLDLNGGLVLAKRIDEGATTPVRAFGSRLYFGTAGGRILSLDVAAGGARLWEYRVPSSEAAVTAGPVFDGDRVVFGTAGGRILALGQDGLPVWEFAADGAIRADPVVQDGRLYFGTEGRRFYCLNASGGQKIWSRPLQGAPRYPALVFGRRLAFTASNSVFYLLARRGGSIVSWTPIASRIIHEPAAAGRIALVSSAAPDLAALDIQTGRTVGRYLAAGSLVAGAIWESSSVVLVEEDPESGRQRLTVLKAR